VVFRILEPIESTPPPVAYPVRGVVQVDRFEWMIEKVTELAWSLSCHRSVRSEKGLFEASRKRRERWVRIARESSQQSRRIRQPEICPRCALHNVSPTRRTTTTPEENSAPAVLRVLPADRSVRTTWRCCSDRRADGPTPNATRHPQPGGCRFHWGPRYTRGDRGIGGSGCDRQCLAGSTIEAGIETRRWIIIP